MAIPSDDTVVVRKGQTPRDLTEITVNCCDKVGLGCDLARIMFEFGLSIVRGDLSTDGRWCFLVFWVSSRTRSGRSVKWSTLKSRLLAVCPSNDALLLPRPKPPPKQHSDVFLLQVHTDDRAGLLNDLTQCLWELELTIQKVHVSTSPDGQAIDFFFISDNRDELPAKHRMEQIREKLCQIAGPSHCDVFCDQLPASSGRGSEAERSNSSSKGGLEGRGEEREGGRGKEMEAPDVGLGVSDCIPYAVQNYLLAEKMLKKEMEGEEGRGMGRKGGAGSSSNSSLVDLEGGEEGDEESLAPAFCPGLGPQQKAPHPAKVWVDNSMSPAHSMLQIEVKDRKGLVYDCLRTLKDLHLQVAYGRISTTEDSVCVLEMYIQGANGRKVVDADEQQELCERMKAELDRPIRIVVVNKGVDTELLVATPVEKSGKGRPRALHDVTSILRQMEVLVFKADISHHEVEGRRWEVYRLILQDKSGQAITKQKTRTFIAHQVRNMLMG